MDFNKEIFEGFLDYVIKNIDNYVNIINNTYDDVYEGIDNDYLLFNLGTSKVALNDILEKVR